MASTTIARGVRRASTQKASRPGFWQSFTRHPFDALWNLFGSVRLAIVLISSILAVGVIGMIVAQAPAEVASSPQDFAAWVATNARQQYGAFTDLMNWLQFFTIFSSWYFKVLVVLLALNILVGGMLVRWPAKWQNFRHPLLKRADGFYVNSPVKAGTTVGQFGATTTETATGVTRLLKRRGYQVTPAPATNDEVAYLYIHKFSWASLSTFVFHTSMILTMLCVVVTGWGGFGRDSMAQRLLPAPVYNYFQNLAGFSYTQPLPDGEGGIVYPYGTEHNIRYIAKDFVSVFDPVRGTPTDFYTDLQIWQDGTLVAQKRIRVNDPLTYQGVTFHQASFMMYTNITLRDASGNVMYSGAIPLLDQRTTQIDPNVGNVLQTNNAENIPISTYGYTMNLAAAALDVYHWYLGVGGYDSNQNQLFKGVALVTPDSPQKIAGCVSSDTSQPVDAGQYGCPLSNGWWMQVTALQRGTVLLITKDSGSPLLWPTLMLLIASLSITFLFPTRRLWARIEGDQVRFAALQEHFVNQQRDIDALVRALGNKPLRPDPVEETTHPPNAKAQTKGVRRSGKTAILDR